MICTKFIIIAMMFFQVLSLLLFYFFTFIYMFMNNLKLANTKNNFFKTSQQTLHCRFMLRCLMLIFTFLLISTDAYQIVVAYNCGSHNNITTKYVKYTSDEMYEGLTSRMALKQSLPSSIVDQQDKKLLISQRTSDYGGFSYFFKISGKEHFLVIFKFIEVKILKLNPLDITQKQVIKNFQYKVGRLNSTSSGHICLGRLWKRTPQVDIFRFEG